MFDFFSMANDYDSRKIDRYEGDGWFVSTCRVTDSPKPFETGISHPDYKDGVVVVECYDTIEEARAGHARWVDKMTNDMPPELVEAGESGICQLMDLVGVERPTYPRKTPAQA